MTIKDSQLGTNRYRLSGLTIGGPGASTNITGHARPCNLNIALDGSAPTTLTLTDLAGLNSGLLVASTLQAAVRALTALGVAATEARVVYSADQQRYAIVSGGRGASSSVVVTVGGVNDIADDLMLTTATGAVSSVGRDDVDLGLVFQSLGGIPSLSTLDAETAFVASPARTRGLFFTTVHDIAAGSADIALYNTTFPRKACLVSSFFEVTAGNAGGRTTNLRDTAAGAGNSLQAAVFDCATTGMKTAFGSASDVATGGSVYFNKSHADVAGRLTICWLFQA